jgi:glycosyltransferase involved in cell wall biosynthesis
LTTTIRVAHFSTSESGGAAIAAHRLSTLLNSRGIKSEVFTRNNLGIFRPSKGKLYYRIVLGKIVTKIQELLSEQKYGTLTPISISSVNLSGIMKSNYDIIHIHNWYNLFSEHDLRILSKRFPLVLTLHDERILTGGCHTTLGCQNFVSNCRNCPGIQIPKVSLSPFTHFLKNVDTDSKDVSLICPSNWMASQANKSPYIAHVNSVSVIPNAISFPKEYKESIFDIETSKEVNLLFVAANVSAGVKGLSFLLETLQSFGSDFQKSTRIKINLGIAGSSSNSQDLDNVVSINYLGAKSPQQILGLMKSYDFLVVPSHSENLPNVISEAQLVGLPVIASNVGGIPEMVQDSKNGFLFNFENGSLMDAIMRAVNYDNLHELRLKARSSAEARLNDFRIYEGHSIIYRKCLGLE